ncbi:MAG: methyltransferase [Cytophagales bacterium]|nr:methyltransferase [Cytophagales bacterium]
MSRAEIERQERTLSFMEKHCPPPMNVFDLGTPNNVSKLLSDKGYVVQNTSGQDLDLETEFAAHIQAEVVTAFEILEHLVAPFNILRAVSSKKLVATVPLNLWFAKAYRNQNDPWDRHFHEFEGWQFDWLLDKSGWRIIDSQKWISKVGINGIRPLLRNFTPRYYAVYAERK